MLHQACGHALIIPIEHIDRQQRLRFATGLGLLARDRRCGAHDMFGGIDDVLVTAVVVAEHDPGRAR
ncbi:hypothetical protein D3C86_1684460 [compost metagenome]